MQASAYTMRAVANQRNKPYGNPFAASAARHAASHPAATGTGSGELVWTLGFVRDADYTLVVPSALVSRANAEKQLRRRLVPNEREFVPQRRHVHNRSGLTLVHISPHGDATGFHDRFRPLVERICGFDGRVRVLIGNTDRWWPRHYPRDAVDALYDRRRCPSLVDVRAQNIYAPDLQPAQQVRTGLMPIGIPPDANFSALRRIAAAALPLRERTLTAIAAEWASPGGRTYPKRPIGFKTRAELRGELRATGLLAPPPSGQRAAQEVLWGFYASHAVVASPIGMGLDCHRTWEALALGCIVLLQDEPVARLLQRAGLPVVVVEADAWETITRAQLLRWVDKLAGRVARLRSTAWLGRRWWLQPLHAIVDASNASRLAANTTSSAIGRRALRYETTRDPSSTRGSRHERGARARAGTAATAALPTSSKTPDQ